LVEKEVESRMAKRAGPLLVAACLLAGWFSAAHAAIPATERAALIAVYVDTNGDGWSSNTGWKAPPLAGDGFAMPGTECGWYSVWCDVGETTVWEIDLFDNLLSGSIPAALEDLSNLQYLILSSNQLSGGIPPELGNLSTLLELRLYDNDLTGSIPPELGNLVNLEILWIDGNDLTGSIPPELGGLANLESLFLFNNQLSGSIPPQLGNLSVLQYLYLNGNALVGPVPIEMMNLSSLLDDWSNFCDNHLYTDDAALSSFLDTKQIGGDWASCQTAAPVPAISNAGLLVLCTLLAGSALWAVGRSERAAERRAVRTA
jgi:hypothetical protein